MLPSLLLISLVGWFTLTPATASEVESSSFGSIAIPQPAKPVAASSCVEPVDIMRRDHMNFLLHQRDATVIEGDRSSKYSLAGCMDCHNPAESAETAVRYPDPEHFCAGCHLYASVKIDCFECHADRSLKQEQQGQLTSPMNSGLLSLQTFQNHLGESGGE